VLQSVEIDDHLAMIITIWWWLLAHQKCYKLANNV